MFDLFVAIVAAIAGSIATGIISGLATSIPSVQEWANHRSPSYMIVVASIFTALFISVPFIVYLEIKRREEIVFLDKIKENSTHATTEANAAFDAGQNWYECNKHSKIALDYTKDNLLPMTDARLKYRINSLLP